MIRHAGGHRPSFKIGQRKYSRSTCGVKIYDDRRFFTRARSLRHVTCKRCKCILKARRALRRECARKDRVLQLKNYRARRNLENVMRARFGLKPVKYDPPPPSDYWSER